jgi:hypothetical protein
VLTAGARTPLGPKSKNDTDLQSLSCRHRHKLANLKYSQTRQFLAASIAFHCYHFCPHISSGIFVSIILFVFLETKSNCMSLQGKKQFEYTMLKLGTFINLFECILKLGTFINLSLA